MKEKIHPEYYDAKVVCIGCSTEFTCGSTVKEMRINICSVCHPFYTGKKVLIDAEGRVDRFKKKYAKYGAGSKTAAAA